MRQRAVYISVVHAQNAGYHTLPASALVPRILIAKIAAMGDVIMASAMVPAIRDMWPEAHVSWLTDAALVPLVRRFEGVDEVIPVNAGKLLAGATFARGSALADCWRSLGLRRWDLGVVAHADPRYRVLVAGARLGKLVTQRAVRELSRPLPWMGQTYADLIRGSAQCLPAVLPQLTTAATGPTRRARAGIVLAPGGARNVLRDDTLRRWPLESWGRVAATLLARGYEVTLVGGVGDLADVQQVASVAPGATNVAGQTTLTDLLALVERAQLVVTHDSGVLHLAALTQTPAVALFGPTAPTERIPPGAPILVATAAPGLPCAPCYDGHGYAHCGFNRCLTGVSANEVLQLVERQLQHEPALFQRTDAQ